MTALTDRIAEVLQAHKPYEAIDGNLYCRNRDCRPATAEDEAWGWAAHVAQRVAAELGVVEERRITASPLPGEKLPVKHLRRWVSGWTQVEYGQLTVERHTAGA